MARTAETRFHDELVDLSGHCRGGPARLNRRRARRTTSSARLTPDNARRTTSSARLTPDNARRATSSARLTPDNARRATSRGRLTPDSAGRATSSACLTPDSARLVVRAGQGESDDAVAVEGHHERGGSGARGCLLYTSDAADEL